MTSTIPTQRNQVVICANCDGVLDDRPADPDTRTNMLAGCPDCLAADIAAIVRQDRSIEAADDTFESGEPGE